MNQLAGKSMFSRLLLFVTLTGHFAAQAAAQYNCPANEGAQYTTPNGITFKLVCGEASNASIIDMSIKPSQTACADWCSENPLAQFCDWTPAGGQCFRFSDKYDKAKQKPANYNPWVPVEDRRPPSVQPQAIPFTTNCPNTKAIDEKATAQFISGEPLCPGDDGKTYLTNDGLYFKVHCAAQNKNAYSVAMASTKSHDLGECLQLCGATQGCKSANFGFTTYDCDLYTSGEEDIIDCPSGNPGIHNVGYLVDPPTYVVPDQVRVRCSTACPAAHGQTYEDKGVEFRMSCCKRHGTEAFAKEEMPSFLHCMQACATLAPQCQSVDYIETTRMCSFLKHSGEPTVLAPGWAAAEAVGCAGACKKGGCGCSGNDEL